ncbi:transposase [Rhodopirellula sp. SWK7]|uniref:transposase n=1 Tax=Rhodopirellula sp. SWK7 TaxID=595460 RepID=UPI000A056249
MHSRRKTFQPLVRMGHPKLFGADQENYSHAQGASGGMLSYFRHRITNAITEGFNSRIHSIKSAARGFRNFANYHLRILSCCGKLEMAPDGCN